ncbi:MAG: helix-turn-helix domain-containing protein [Thaumarchaeota archaeon]|nr:helix-turn-helix domain-containing protein [Nitrososphaerota archaeon]
MGNSEVSPFPSEVFAELASDTRCSILHMLLEKPTRTNKLAKDLGLTVQETHRNTARLVEAGLIRKDPEGFFLLTEYGRLAAEQIPYYQFLLKHKKFFDDHVCDLPPKFKQRLGALRDCDLVTKVTNVQQRIKKMESEAEEKIQLIVSQAWEEEGRTLLDRLKKGVKVSTIFGFDSVMPDEIAENLQKKITSFIPKGTLEQKMVEGSLKIAVYIADRKAAVIFPNQKGEIDMSTLFFGKEQEFYGWCRDYFDYLSEKAKPMVKGRTKLY